MVSSNKKTIKGLYLFRHSGVVGGVSKYGPISIRKNLTTSQLLELMELRGYGQDKYQVSPEPKPMNVVEAPRLPPRLLRRPPELDLAHVERRGEMQL